MSREFLSFVLFLLAVFGFWALAGRLLRAAGRLALSAAGTTAATGLAELSERRGDITGFMQHQAEAQTLRRARRATLALGAVYLLLLVVPPFTGAAREVYAACSALWLLPRSPRPRLQAPPSPPGS